VIFFRWNIPEDGPPAGEELQIPPLRFASVGMTRGESWLSGEFAIGMCGS
jgi:hypothetical protein